jgi:hypothetical protein
MLGEALVNRSAGSEPVHQYDYRETLAVSQKENWKIEDIIGEDKQLDFSKRFMPEALARVDGLTFLNSDEKRVLNQVRGHTYLTIFGIVEEFILPFVLDYVRPGVGSEEEYRIPAFLQFASEEAKHIQLFKTFHSEFRKGFETECKVIGPAAEIAKAVLGHDPFGVALTILMIEWMSQRHFTDSIKDDNVIDERFKSLLKNHWIEEAQHAKLDTRMVEDMAKDLSPAEIEKGIDEFLAIGGFLDEGLKQQVLFDLEAFELATGRILSSGERADFIDVQTRANRYTYIGSGMTHAKFLESLGKLDPKHRVRIEEIAPAFC